jgi:hypothetical protein
MSICLASRLARGVANNLEEFDDFDRLLFIFEFASSETDLFLGSF